MPSPLGSLEPVDLRTIWPDAARDFTTWTVQGGILRHLSNPLTQSLFTI
jgi:hypothetical protein